MRELPVHRSGSSLQLPQAPQLGAADRLRGGHPVLQTGDVQEASLEVDLVPAQAHKLRDPQRMTVSDQEEGAITGAVPADLAGGGEYLVDFIVREIFSGSPRGVGEPPRGEGGVRGRSRSPLLNAPGGLARGNLPIFEDWGRPLRNRSTFAVWRFSSGLSHNPL
jgi:hypothetical protein